VQRDLKNLRVLARASPADKLALVHVLKAMGEVMLCDAEYHCLSLFSFYIHEALFSIFFFVPIFVFD